MAILIGTRANFLAVTRAHIIFFVIFCESLSFLLYCMITIVYFYFIFLIYSLFLFFITIHIEIMCHGLRAFLLKNITVSTVKGDLGIPFYCQIAVYR